MEKERIFENRLLDLYSLTHSGYTRANLEDEVMIFHELRIVCRALIDEIEEAYSELRQEEHNREEKKWYNPTNLVDKITAKLSEREEAMAIFIQYPDKARAKLDSLQDIIDKVVKPQIRLLIRSDQEKIQGHIDDQDRIEEMVAEQTLALKRYTT